MNKDRKTSSIPIDKLSSNELRTYLVNLAVVDIVKEYLRYGHRIVKEAFGKDGYDAMKFKEIGDELILTPEELLDLIDKLQVALSEI
jgi:hypothetical protein